MLQCFGLELLSEMGVLLEAQRFNGPSQSIYVIFFYSPPCAPLLAESLAGRGSCCSCRFPCWHLFGMAPACCRAAQPLLAPSLANEDTAQPGQQAARFLRAVLC
jgi:hypothetical protein